MRWHPGCTSLAHMTTIDLAQLANVTGGYDNYDTGYKLGKDVTQGLLDVGEPGMACQQVGAPFLEKIKMPLTAAGARQAVIDTCAKAGVPVR
jgi:hypothetical protein